MRLIRGALALVILTGLLVGLPVGLFTFGTLDGLPAPSDIWDTLSRPDDGTLLVSVLTVAGWIGWASFALSVLVELPFQLRRIPSPRLPAGLGVPQAGARVLVAAVIAIFAVAGAPGSSHGATEVVEPGDTLSGIAAEHLGDGRLWPQIAQANPDVENPDLIHPGDQLQVPDQDEPKDQAGASVAVEPGDTLSGIAAEHLGDGRLWPQIAQANPDVEDPDLIHPGDQLQVPTEEAEPVVTLTSDSQESTNDEELDEQDADQGHAVVEAAHAVARTPQPPVVPDVETASPRAEPAPATSAPDTDAEADSASPGALAIGACTAAVVLLLLAARRAAQSRHRKPGRRIAMPTGPAAAIEPRLRKASDPLAVEHLDRALRTIAEHAHHTGITMPALSGALITPDAIEIYLVEGDAQLPEPFRPVDDDPGSWTLSRAAARRLLDEAEAADVPAPYPTLVTVGHDGNDGWVLLNLEEVGALNISGSRALCQATLAAMTLELIGSQWADDLRVTLVGILPELAHALGSDRVEHADSLADVLPGLAYAADVHGRSLSGASQPSAAAARAERLAPETWTPHVLVLTDEPTGKERQQLELILEHAPRLAVAAITTGDHPMSPWVLNTSGQVGVLEPAGVAVTPQTLSAGEYAELVEVFGTTEADDIPGPDWTRTLTAETDLTALLALQEAPDTDATPQPVTEPTPDQDLETSTGEPPQECEDSAMGSSLDIRPLRHHGPVVRLLGPVAIQQAPGKRPQSPGRATELISFLSLHPSDGHELMDEALWPGQRVDAKRRNPLVTQSRKWLGEAEDGRPLLSYADDGGYRLHDGVMTDWRELQRILGDDVSESSTADLIAALRTVEGQPMSGVSEPYYRWADADRQEMIQTVADLAHEVAARALASGDSVRAAWAAAKGTSVAPESEQLWRDRLRAAWLSAIPGRVAGIVNHMTATLEPIGGDMEPETTELIQQLMTDEGPARAHA